MSNKTKALKKEIKKEEKLVKKILETLSNGDVRAYRGNPLLKRQGEVIEFTAAHVKEYKRCAKDPVYFAERYIKIVHVDRGLIPIVLYDYQKKLIRMCHDERFLICLACRQSGKSTSTICFLLWYLLFNPSKSVALLANKGATSRMLLARIQLAYYNLPKWLQQGIVDWNKGSFSLENGSRIVAASTSSDSIRGDSFGTIILDEMAFIPKNTYDEFYKSVYPTISSGTETKFIAVSTPNGMNHFYDAWMKAVEKKSRFVPIEVNWWDVPGRDEAWKDEQLANMSEEDFSQEYGNSFVGSQHTLLRPDTLSRIDRDCLKPIQTSKQTAIFKEPLWGHKYIATVDCADTGDDASTISIIDITNYPYEQVARFKDNKISHLSFPQIIMNFAAKYNMADVLVESNDVGKVILHILNYDIGYENIVSTKIGTRIGLGQRTTSKTKPIGCARLKDMLESGKMIIRDADTSTELKHFVLDGHSYAAEEGYHDDLVMGLVNLAYYANTSSFRYHHDSNFTDEYRKEYEESIMEMLTPLPMFSVDNEVDEEDLSFLRELRS